MKSYTFILLFFSIAGITFAQISPQKITTSALPEAKKEPFSFTYMANSVDQELAIPESNHTIPPTPMTFQNYSFADPTDDCPAPETYFVGEYAIQDFNATISTENFQTGIFTVTGNGNTRTFSTQLLPQFISIQQNIDLLLNCGIIEMSEVGTGLTCGGPPIIFSPQDNANSTVYDLSDDSSFIINYIEDSLSSCGGPFDSSFSMTKICSMPQNVSFSNATASSVDLNWLDTNNTSSSSNLYNIEYGVQGFAIGTGQTINGISGNTQSISNLQTNTAYEFYIQGACSDGTFSQLAGPFEYGFYDNPDFTLAPNGITCLCPNANIGDIGTLVINGEAKTFTKRTRFDLDALISTNIQDQQISLSCTSGITDMSSLFENRSTFNQNLEHWDTSNVSNMHRMFSGAGSFNQPLDSWDVSSVTDMSWLFQSAISFNQNINNWDTSNVTSMQRMFGSAPAYNQPMDLWNTSNVTDMSFMFINLGLSSFNQPLDSWDVSNVTNMAQMLAGTNFNFPLNSWDVSQVTDVNAMFVATPFNQPLDNWDVSNVTNMAIMFSGASNFNQDISNWNVNQVTSMSGMFNAAYDYNQDLSTWVFNEDVNLINFLNHSNLDPVNYDALLQSFNNQNLLNLTLGAANIGYCDEVTRNDLITNKSWTIEDDLKGQCGDSFNPSTTPFVTTWEVDVPDLSVEILTIAAYNYNFNIDWGDGTVDSNVTTDITHFYNSPGIYTVSIVGVFPYFKTCNVASGFAPISTCNNSQKLLSVESWGNQEWRNFVGSFRNAQNFYLNTTQAPDLTNVVSFKETFKDAINFNQNIDNWDVSNILDMTLSFEGASSFNQPLNSWNVSNVTSMNRMFQSASSFNQPLNSWNVSNVTSMNAIFSSASSFNQPIDSWDVSSVTNMQSMFGNTQNFNQPLDNWDISNVTTTVGMFFNATAFDQPLLNWNTANVTSMNNMFYGASTFNKPIDNWNTSNVTNMISMFFGASAFNQPLGNWDTSNISNMDRMFQDASNFNQDISNWCVENVLEEPLDFSLNSALVDSFKPDWGIVCDININPDFTLDTNGVTCLCPNADFGDTGTLTINGEQFTFTKRTEQELRDLADNFLNSPQIRLTCTSGITDMSSLFANKELFDNYLEHWDVSNVTSMEEMFYFTNYNEPLNNWDVSRVTDMSFMFGFNSIFNQPLDNWDVSSVTDMNSVFVATDFNQNINNWDVSNVENMTQLFASTPFNQSVDNWDVGNVTIMDRMFLVNTDFNQPLNSWNVSKVINMNNMFGGGFSASGNSTAFNQPLDNWDTSNVEIMSGMFRNSSFNQNISNWDVSNVTNMAGMFSNSENFDQPLNNWNVSNVTNMSFLFSDSAFDQALNEWNVISATNMDGMFLNSNFNQDISSWCVEQIPTEPTNFSTNSLLQINFIPAWGVACNIQNANFVLDSNNVTCLCPDAAVGDVGTININGQLRTFTKRSENMLRGLVNADISNQQIALTCTSAVTDMSNLFKDKVDFNQTLEHWDVSNVTDMSGMFENATSFNIPVNASDADLMSEFISSNLLLSGWDVSNVTDMDFMFKNATVFNQDISFWCVEQIPSEPTEFSLNSALQDSFKPNWGATCSLSVQDVNFVNIKVYPNPTSDKVYIENPTTMRIDQIKVFNILGKVVQEKNNINQNQTNMDLSELATGTYIVQILTQNAQKFVKRVIKK